MAKELQLAVGNYREHMETREYPLCFTSKEFKAWKVLENELHTQPIRAFVCRDCNPQYQARMAASHRCVNSSIDLSKIVD
jgi:hypothetical protein